MTGEILSSIQFANMELIYQFVHSSSRNVGDGGNGGLWFFSQLQASLMQENIKIWCNIQVIISISSSLTQCSSTLTPTTMTYSAYLQRLAAVWDYGLGFVRWECMIFFLTGGLVLLGKWSNGVMCLLKRQWMRPQHLGGSVFEGEDIGKKYQPVPINKNKYKKA